MQTSGEREEEEKKPNGCWVWVDLCIYFYFLNKIVLIYTRSVHEELQKVGCWIYVLEQRRHAKHKTGVNE